MFKTKAKTSTLLAKMKVLQHGPYMKHQENRIAVAQKSMAISLLCKERENPQ